MKCAYCDKEFEGRKRKYCSRECQTNADKYNKRIHYVGKREKICALCKKKLPKFKTRFCSDDCQRRFYHIQKGFVVHSEILTKECTICGKPFKTWRSKKGCCSNKCRKRLQSLYSLKRYNRYKETSQSKDINLERLAKRDNDQCQICGLFVNWDDKQIINGKTICGNMYPSIDHIIPISLGGSHSWNNIQLAHRICNSKKGNRIVS